MPQRGIEAAPTRPPDERRRAREQADRLAAATAAAVPADRGVTNAETVAQLQRLSEVPGGHLDLVTLGLERAHDRPHDQDVRAVGQVDPDAHARTTSSTWSRV